MNSYDIDLNPVLEGASNDELQMIAVQMEDRVASSLTDFSEYKKAKETGDYTKVRNLLADELREFGGNTIANIARKVKLGKYQGPSYREIVYDVDKKLKLKPRKDMPCDHMEQLIIDKSIQQMWEELSVEEREELLKTVNVKGNSTYSAFSAAMHTFIRTRGFMPYKVTLIIINAISKKVLGRGLSLATNAAAMKLLAGTLARSLNVLLWGWFVNDIAFSPAFRVTTPCVIIVAFCRQRQLAEARIVLCRECENECDKIEHQYCPKCGTKLGDK
jgi:uncharacterized protein YaaW (UPF0174 family)